MWFSQVRASLPGSYENLLHAAAGELHRRYGGGGHGHGHGHGGAAAGHRFALDFRHGERRALEEALEGPLLERFIGVIYRPRTERQSHYSYSSLPRQFDMVRRPPLQSGQAARAPPVERDRGGCRLLRDPPSRGAANPRPPQVVHLDRTRALHPLEKHGTWEVERMEDADETFPFGL